MWCTTDGIARPRLDGRDPLVLGPARIDHEHLVVDHAGGRHVERLRRPCTATWSGLGIIQPSANLGGSGRSLGLPSGAPLATHLAIVALSASLIRASFLKWPKCAIGVPGRHALRLHDFFDHAGPAGDFLVVGQRERRDLSRAMAEHAIGVQDPRDLLGVGHVAVGHGLAVAADQAAGRLRSRAWLTGLPASSSSRAVGQVALVGAAF